MLCEVVFYEFSHIHDQFSGIKQVNVGASIEGKIDLMAGVGTVLPQFFDNGQRIRAHECVGGVAAHHQRVKRQCLIFHDFSKSGQITRAHGIQQGAESGAGLGIPRLGIRITFHQSVAGTAAHGFFFPADD